MKRVEPPTHSFSEAAQPHQTLSSAKGFRPRARAWTYLITLGTIPVRLARIIRECEEI